MFETVLLVCNCVLIGFLLLGMFFGLIRGLKKTISRGIFLLITSIILIFVTFPITKIFLNIPFTFEDANGSTTVTLIEYVSSMTESFLGKSFLQKNPDLVASLLTIPLLIINSIVFIILFWLLKYLLLPINALLNLIFIKKKHAAIGLETYPNGISITSTTGENIEDKYKDNIGIKTIEEPIAISEEEPKPQKQKKTKQKIKVKKYRLWGAFVGLFVGVIVMFNTMIPVYGIMSIVKQNKEIEINQLSNTPVSLSTLTSGISDDLLKGYELSALGRVSYALGLEHLGLATFDYLTSTNINDKKITLRKDIASISSTLQEIDDFIELYNKATKDGIQKISQENLTSLLNGAYNIINKTEQVQLINALSDLTLPMAYDYIQENSLKLVENQANNELILDTIKTVCQNKDIKIFSEIKSIIDVAKYLDSQKLLYPIISGNYSNIFSTIDNLEPDFATNFTTKLFAIKTLDNSFASALNIGLQMFDDATKFGYEKNTATAQELKDSFNLLINNTIKVAKSLSEESSIYITEDSFIPIGEFLDTFRNSKLFNIATYDNLVDYAINNIKNVSASIIPENFIDTFNNKILRNMSEVTCWKDEMQIFADTFKILRDKEYGIIGEIQEDKDLRVGMSIKLSINEGTLINIGKALDKLETSTLLGTTSTITLNGKNYENSSLVSLVSSLLNEAKSNLDSEEGIISNILNIVDEAKSNLVTNEHIIYLPNTSYWEDKTYTPSTFWEDEMRAIAPLVTYVKDLSESENLDITNKLGEVLDTCASSIMLGKNTTLKLMDTIVTSIKDEILGKDYTNKNDDSINDSINNLLTDISTNLNSNSLYAIMKNNYKNNLPFWKTEIESIIELKEIADKAENINSISSAKALATRLDKVYIGNIIPDDSINKTIATILKQLKTTSSSTIENKINSLIDDIANDISTPNYFDGKIQSNFWQIELNYIDQLKSIEFEGDNAKNQLKTTGKILDSITLGKKLESDYSMTNTQTRASYLLTENRVRELLSTSITEIKNNISGSFEDGEIKNSINTALDSISSNIYNQEATNQVEILSFELELTHLHNLSNLEINSDLFKYNSDLSTLKSNLRNLGSKLDLIAHNTITTLEDSSNITRYDNIKNSRIITREILSNIITSAFTTAKVVAEAGQELTNIQTMFNTTIDNVCNSINEIIVTNPKVITWNRELDYVGTLINLSNGKTITLNNVVDEVATNIDLISFNYNSSTFNDITYQDGNIVGIYTITSADTSTTPATTIFYNSVIITRPIMQTAVNSLLDSLKTEAEIGSTDEIANELIDNIETKINTNSLSLTQYNDYKTAFNDLNEIKGSMEEQANAVDNTSNIITLINDTAENIDNMLNNFQEKPISGIITTRKIAKLIAEKVQVQINNISPHFATSEAGLYLSSLISHFETNTTKENYVTSTTAEYDNPFVTFKEKLNSFTI